MRYEINEYTIIPTNAGLAQYKAYNVYKDGKNIGTCWSLDEISKLTNIDVDTLNRKMKEIDEENC